MVVVVTKLIMKGRQLQQQSRLLDINRVDLGFYHWFILRLGLYIMFLHLIVLVSIYIVIMVVYFRRDHR
jgi:hypothetical protein